MPKIKVQRDDVLTKEEIAIMVSKCLEERNLRNAALVSILYITGARISEIISIRKEDIVIDNEKILIKIRTRKRRERSGITFKHQLSIDKKTPYLNIFLEWLDQCGSKVFDISRIRAYQIVKKLNPETWPHLFRHTRATRFAEGGATTPQLMIWFGWKTPQPAGKYIERSAKRIEDLGKKID